MNLLDARPVLIPEGSSWSSSYSRPAKKTRLSHVMLDQSKPGDGDPQRGRQFERIALHELDYLATSISTGRR